MGFGQYLLLIGIGLIPSIFWLFFYLKKDCHPEPRYLITRTFLMGIIISPIAIILQLGFLKLSILLNFPITDNSPTFFLWAAFAEEMIKFLAVKMIILNNPAFDEPIDAMIYMVTAGLGFAAIENILFMFNIIPDGVSATVGIWTLRFMGAILLHALSSALVGYFLAISWFYQHHKKKLIFIGLFIATVFHFTFNTFLSTFENQFIGLMYATSLLMAMAFMVAILFDKVRERHEYNLRTQAIKT